MSCAIHWGLHWRSCSSAPLPAAAAVIADQNTLVPTGLGDFALSAQVRASPGSTGTATVQTLTAAQTGLLTGVDAQVYGNTGTFRFSLYDGDLAAGTASFVGSIDRAFSALPSAASQATSSFDLSAFNYHVTPGKIFSLLSSAGSARANFSQSIGYYPPGVVDENGDPVPTLNASYAGGSASRTMDAGATWSSLGVDRGYRTFVDVATSADAPLLPTGGPSNAFEFTFAAKPGERVFIDPPVTSGYDYQVASGPGIATALFPLLAGDANGYTLYALDGHLLGHATGGVAFDFGAGGVTGFRLRGIDVALSATDPAAFVTGLTFTGAGSVTLTQTPNPVANVPEPASWALMIAGFALVGGAARRRRMVAA